MRRMRKHGLRHKMNNNSDEDRYANIKQPASWGLVTALSYVLALAEDSELDDKFWEKVRPALDFLNPRLGLNDIQLVLLAVMIEEGDCITWLKLGGFLGLSRLQTMSYGDDMDKMIEKGWVIRCQARDVGAPKEGFRLEKGVVKAIRQEKPFVPENLTNLNLQEFLDRVTNRVENFLQERWNCIDLEMDWYRRLIKSNPDLELCHHLKSFENEYDQVLLLILMANYSLFAESENEGVGFGLINRIFPDEIEADRLRSKLKEDTHPLIHNNYIENKNEAGLADSEIYVLHSNVKENLLSEFKPCRLRCPKGKKTDRLIKSHETIVAKNMFYNPFEKFQVSRLTKLLNAEHFGAVQSRLKETGMREGFTCLFYGAPGTGKTETVMQLARLTGRDIMNVEIAGLRDKWVGESEKNIKYIFSRYRELCKNCDRKPILLFNEVDAIISKRMEDAHDSVDKMNNSMQNIILQEMEELDGILIATTNLTYSLDNAFERRFLFKIEFKNPEVDVKCDIWESMLGSTISHDDAMALASEYDFSGGQIENIVRKQTVDYILEGRRASLDNLRSLCNEEKIKCISRHEIGFR